MFTATMEKKIAPPKAEARKAKPLNTEYEVKAKALLRYAMAQRGVGVEELHEGLTALGVKISLGGLANKISRGSFSAMFMLQCMEALDINLVISGR